MSHRVWTVARETAGDSCRQLQKESKLLRLCFQTAGLQMSQWRPSRSIEQEPMGLIVGHSWSSCLNSVKSPRQTEATHSLCVTLCPPWQERPQRICHTRHGFNYVFVCSLFIYFTWKQYVQHWWAQECFSVWILWNHKELLMPWLF